MTDAFLLTWREWTFRYRAASITPARVFLLLHGWTGDENSMGIFANMLGPDCAALAPRAIHPAAQGGWSWREIEPASWGFATFDDLQPAANRLAEFLDGWPRLAGLDAAQVHVIGFSQGAALAYALAALHPGRVASVAALSGFLPSGIEVRLDAGALREKKVYVAHGAQDDIVPVLRAREAARLLGISGARVEYCESGGGHKAGKECLKGMEFFLKSDTIDANSKKEQK